MKDFSPCYVWPNEVIPFRLYLNDPLCRIFIIENLQHNFRWLSKYRKGIKETDCFLVIIGCYYHEWLVNEAKTMLDHLDLNVSQFHILFNDERDQKIFKDKGFQGQIINQNAWIDENLVMQVRKAQKEYDGIYVGRRSAVKRHMLASRVSRLAIVAGDNHGNNIAPIPNTSYLNSMPLSPDEVCDRINMSCSGLILSEKEGACFASSEYLLCGVPVVSTISEGGRDIWYNEYNSKIVEPCPIQIAEAVEFFKSHTPDPNKIRRMHIEQATEFRFRFSLLVRTILANNDINYIDTESYFEKHFTHKMRPYIKPDFETIFSSG